MIPLKRIIFAFTVYFFPVFESSQDVGEADTFMEMNVNIQNAKALALVQQIGKARSACMHFCTSKLSRKQ